MVAVVTAGAVAAADAVTVSAADAVTVAGADAATAAAASELLLICGDDGSGAADAGELAAIAAAAIASGAVALPDAGVAVGICVDARITGIATATAFGVVTDAASCCAEAATVEASGAEVVSEEDFSVDFFSVDVAVPAFKVLDCWTASVLAAEPCLATASRSSELVPAGWSAGAASRDRLVSAAVDASSVRRCDADCGCAVELARSLPVSAGARLSTSPRRPSLPSAGSGFARFRHPACQDNLVSASYLSLATRGPPPINWGFPSPTT